LSPNDFVPRSKSSFNVSCVIISFGIVFSVTTSSKYTDSAVPEYEGDIPRYNRRKKYCVKLTRKKENRTNNMCTSS